MTSEAIASGVINSSVEVLSWPEAFRDVGLGLCICIILVAFLRS